VREYFLQAGDAIQKGIAGAGEKSVEAVNKAEDFSDIPGYQEEKQTSIDENQVNQAFEPANNIFDGLREAGDWMMDFISDLLNQLFGNLM